MPFVSVVVPMRNERRYIQHCLQSISVQDYPHHLFEVIVVDGGSTDGSRELVESMAGSLPQLRVVENRGKHTSRGLNIGLAYARGEVIARVDAHAAVAQDFLSQAVAALARTNADAVGGPIETLGDGPTGEAIARAVSSPFGVGNAVFRYSQREQWTDTVAFPSYRRDVFDRIGPFAEIDAGEDDDFHLRLVDAGGRLLLTPDIRSTYYARRTFAELLRQYFLYGQAKSVVLRRHPRRTRLRQLVPSAFVVSLLASAILVLFGGIWLLPLALLGASYISLLAVALVSIGERRPGRAALIALALVCMHLSYGTGFLTGLLRRSLGQRVAVPREAEAP